LVCNTFYLWFNVKNGSRKFVVNQKRLKCHFSKEVFCLSVMTGIFIIHTCSIINKSQERSYTIFHLDEKRNVTVSKSLIEYDNLLQDTQFIRIHKSFLINLHHVKEYQRGEGGMVIMTDNAEIEVSRRKKEFFMNRMKELYKY